MVRATESAGHGTSPETGDEAALLKLWVAQDPQSHRITEIVCKVALTPTTVLICGESGTGKDLLAQMIHYLGPRHDEPLLKIDCASLPAELVESELFGHERGAFTGADVQKRGRLELAGGGTIVLDEVAALTFAMQAKLLRVIEEKQFERLGGATAIRIRARLIALTNADLEQAVARGDFCEDLYFRLNVFPIVLPHCATAAAISCRWPSICWPAWPKCTAGPRCILSPRPPRRSSNTTSRATSVS